MFNRLSTLVFPLLLVAYEISCYLSNDMYLPALPQLMKDLNISAQQAQLTLTMWFLGSAGLPLVMGMISDRYGRRSVVLSGGIMYVVAVLISAITTSGNVFMIARFLQGAAIPSLLVAGYACIHELYDTKESIKILALMGSISVLAPAFGPLLGSIFLYLTSWRGIFYFIGGFAAISLLLLAKYMPETLPEEKRVPLHFKTIFKQYLNILKNKQFMLRAAIFGLLFAGFIVWITGGPLLIIEYHHYTPLVLGLIQGVAFTVYILANRSVGYFLEKIGPNKLIHLGLSVALCGGLLGALFSFFYPDSIWLYVISITIYSLGGGLCFAPLNRLTIESSSEPMGIRTAMFTVSWSFFIILGSLVPTLILPAHIGAIAYPIAIIITIAFLGNLLFQYNYD